MELLIVTGMSGAGKSQVVNVLEDIGYYCVDNIPPQLIPSFVNVMSGNQEIKKAAIVIDVRAGKNFVDIPPVLEKLAGSGVEYKILFLDCADDVLVRRYKETRRKHPLSEGKGSLIDAVKSERKLLDPVRQKSDFVLVTTQTSVRQLKEQINLLFVGNSHDGMAIRCMSFGFKHGPATEADLMFDVRCLPNPYYIDSLREQTGLDPAIKDFVLGNKESQEFKKRLLSFIDYAVPLYCSEGKGQLVIAVGCTGGKHRSVVFAELVEKHLREQNYNTSVIHRDITK